jgi:hypothetical protein
MFFILNDEVCSSIAANGHGLAMWRYLKIVSPCYPEFLTQDLRYNKNSI